jgi:hypothetical protein
MIKKIISVTVESMPIFLMIGLIPLVQNDFYLTILYIVLTMCSFFIRYTKNDLLVYSIGFAAMTFFECIFILTGVETFIRNSLFGIMPLWLPFLWAYGFVVIKRAIAIIES